MQTDTASEIDLINRCKLRDTEAFGELYEAYVGRVYKHVYYLVGNRTDAEDLTEQTFLQAWEAIGRFEWRGKPVASWLLTIAHNLTMNRFRNGHKEFPLDEVHAQQQHPVLPEEAYLAASLLAEVKRAILRLKPLEREVILLRFVDGMNYESLAESLGKTVNAIRVTQFRALRNLRKMLTEVEPGGSP